MNREARRLAARLNIIRLKSRTLVNELETLDSDELSEDLRQTLVDITSRADDFGAFVSQGYQYALLLGWGRSSIQRRYPEFTGALAAALQRRATSAIPGVAAIESNLGNLYWSATAHSRSSEALAHERIAAGKLAEQLNSMRSQFKIIFSETEFKGLNDVLEALIKACDIDVTLSENAAGRFAKKLISASVSLLPRQHQLRYFEEFRGEAETMHGWSQRFYALNLLWHCLALRKELSNMDDDGQ